jgi:hypothetical protein
MQTQIRITKTPQITDALNFIKSKYFLLDDVEIIKMAIANQYSLVQQSTSSSTPMDETEYLTSSPVNKKRLDDAIAQPISTAKKFTNLKELANEIGFDY